jgi:drug/metabolite transporter (DMT)-like permease
VLPGRRLPRQRTLWLYGCFLGLISTALPMTVTMSSLRLQSSGVTSIYVTMAPAIIVVMAHFFLPDEQLSWPKMLGVLLALGGALLLVVRGESGLPDVAEASPLGFFLVLSGLIGEGFGAMFIRRRMRNVDPFDITFIRLVTAALAVLLLALFAADWDFSQLTRGGYAAIGYAAVIGALLAQLLAFSITSRFGATPFSLVGYIVPAVAAITGVLLLDEQITGVMLAGMGLIVVGITLINWRRRAVAPRLV